MEIKGFDASMKHEKPEFDFFKKNEITWSGYVKASRGYDECSEAKEEIPISYKNGKFYVQNKEISCGEFMELLGPGLQSLYRQKPELEKIFNEALLKEKNSRNSIMS